MKKIIVTMALFFLTACGGGSDEPTTPSSKPLFSLWYDLDGVPLDLTNGQFSTPIPYLSFYDSGLVCECTAIVAGSELNGSFTLTSCYASSQPVNGAALSCDALNQAGSYTNTQATLTIQGFYNFTGTANDNSFTRILK